MKKVSFYQCKDCHTVLLGMCGAAPSCCGQELVLLEENKVDAAVEKHIPDAVFEDGKLRVKVGSVAHPMTREHQIMWIYVQTRKGGMYAELSCDDAPEAVFAVEKSDVVAIYEFCNLHGLWVLNVAKD